MNARSSDILLSVTGTVTIETEEFCRLIKHSAYLDIIMAFAGDPKESILTDIICVVQRMLKDAGTESTAEDGESDKERDCSAPLPYPYRELDDEGVGNRA